jgi:hypothetical protein
MPLDRRSAARVQISCRNAGGKGSRTSSLKFRTSRRSVMSENRTSTNRCWRLAAAPRWYFVPTLRSSAARFTLPSALFDCGTGLCSSLMLDRLGPDVHHLAAYERLHRFSSVLGKKP